MHNHNGYMASITGAVSGGLLLGILTACLAFTLALSLPTSVIITGFMCLMPGLFVGAVVGCWLALRWGEYPRAGTTARYLASLLVIHVGIVPLVLLGTELILRPMTWFVWFLVMFGGLPTLARWLVLPLTKNDNLLAGTARERERQALHE